LVTTYGDNTYQLVVNFVDANGVSGQITSNPIDTSILRDVRIDVSGTIQPGTTLTSTAASFDYVINDPDSIVTSVSVDISNSLTNELIETILMTDLIGTVNTTVELSPLTAYRAVLTAETDIRPMILADTTVRTLPNFIFETELFINTAVTSVMNDSALLTVQASGSATDLAGISTANFTLNNGTVVTLNSVQLADLKAGQNVSVNIPNLTAATNYVATFNLTGSTIAPESSTIQNFRTLPANNGTTTQPVFTSNHFYQPTVGTATVGAN